MKKTIFFAFLFFFLTLPLQSFADCPSGTFEALGGKSPGEWCWPSYRDECNRKTADFCHENYQYHIRCIFSGGLGCLCDEDQSFKLYCPYGCENEACKNEGEIPGTGLCSDNLNALGGKTPAKWCEGIYDCFNDGSIDVCEGNNLYLIRCSNVSEGLCHCDAGRSKIVVCTAGCSNGECLEPEDVACEWIRDGYCGGGDCESYESREICGPSGCDPAKSESECKVPGETRCIDIDDCLKAAQVCNNDGAIDEGEQCDGENVGLNDCSDFGFTEGNLSCEDCVFDVSDCSGYTGGGNGGGGNTGGGNTGGGLGGSALIENPLSFDTLVELLNKIMNFIWKLAIVFAPIMLLVGGFYIMTAGGNPTNLEKGKKIMIYTVIGFAIVLLSRALVSLFKEILGAKDTQSLLQMADALKVFCFSGIMDVKKTLFKRSAN